MARVAFIGNFGPAHSSESHEALSYEALGHTVCRIQEGEVRATDIPRVVKEFDADLVHWVQTYGLAVTGGDINERRDMVNDIKSLGIPTVAYHLDLWWGLGREMQVLTEPYFECDYVFSTDGGHDDNWHDAGINHLWLPPAVYHAEAVDALPNPAAYRADVAFVGSWRGYGHAEHEPTRMKMLKVLEKKYGRRFRKWPIRTAVRGEDLNELYASVKVVVGDSCLAGQVAKYWSDRIPETTGRGGFLIHPYVTGLLNTHPDLVTFEPGNWDEMVSKVDHYLENDAAREANRRMNSDWTRVHHTYKNRMAEVLRIAGIT